VKGIPDEFERIVRMVLAYRPKPKTKAARKRKRLRVEKEKQAKPA
jgi:hypothetical protein